MEKTISLLKGPVFESSAVETPQFRSFARTFKREFSAYLTNQFGAQEFEIRKGHFEASGFFRVGAQLWYFSLADVRFWRNAPLLVRTAKNNKDYTGGSNCAASLESVAALTADLTRLVGRV